MGLKGLVVVPDATAPQRGPIRPFAAHIANRPIICHVVHALASAGVRDVGVVAPVALIADVRRSLEAEPEMSVDELSYLSPTEGADLRGALLAAEDFVGDDACIAHPADGLVSQDLDAFVEALTIGAVNLLLLLHRSAERRDWLEPAVHRLLRINEIDRTRSRLALTGVCLLGPGALRRTSQRLTNTPHRRGLAEIAWSCASDTGTVEAAVVPGWRRYAGAPGALLELNRIAAPREHSNPADNRIEGPVVIHPTAEVEASVILGPSIVGAQARISSSYIGPYTSIGARAEIDSAEIVRSIVGEEARIMHVGGRIEESTIGRSASIFRDLGLPRALRLHVGEDVQLALT